MYLPRGGPAQGVYLPRGCTCYGRGCTCYGRGVYLPGGCTSLGVVPEWGCTCPGTLPCEQNDRQVQKYYLAPNFVGGNKPFAGGRVVSELDCYVGGLTIESSILPLLKYTCGEQGLAAMLAVKMLGRRWQVLHQR